ncbi:MULTISPECIES: LEA type 2 family protein [Desulfosediminicola]|uniref:LEA type 2 family protein n=1 Tax=Desulfosediminicola TaxID=2886823 RepID=UPI0010ACAFCF|nr:LEA type 2 family protein [Desulfosediminicola ganghwensis]
MKNISRAAIPFIFLFTYFLFIAGCALTSLESPEVTLADVQVSEIRSFETVFLVQLRVQNPNEKPLDIEGLSCEMELDGRKFASGLQGAQQTIPPYGTALVPVEVYASVIDMVGSAISMVKSASKKEAQFEDVNYKLSGTVNVKMSGFSHKLPFESSGKIDLN